MGALSRAGRLSALSVLVAALVAPVPPAFAQTAHTPARVAAPPSARCATLGVVDVKRPVRHSPQPRAVVRAMAVNAAYSAPDTPRRMIPGDEYAVRVTLTNTTTTPFSAAQHALSYHWTLPGGTDATPADRLETKLPDLAPGATVTVDAKVKTPTLADVGNEREQFVLRWDVRDTATNRWLSETAGVPTLDQDVRVERPTSDQLGLEQFYQYGGVGTGAGGNLSVNQFSGNAVWGYDALTNPSRGLASFVRFTYNSADTSDSYTGTGWSVTASTLNRLGTPLEFSGTGWASTVTLVDGDGTGHFFELNKNGSDDSAHWTYDSPAGVHLYLRHLPKEEDSRRWVFTTPERTHFYFDHQGYHTSTVEKNGNTMTFSYEQALVGGRNAKVLTHVTDATGRRTLTLDYYQRDDPFTIFRGDRKVSGAKLAEAAVIDQLKSVTDVSGRVIHLTYGEHGALQEVVDGVGRPEAKTFTFFYDSTTANLIRVVDPLGHSTGVEYFTDDADPLRKGHVRTVKDRRGAAIGFDYADPDGTKGSEIDASLTDGNGHTSRVLIDGFGRPTRLTNAKKQATTLHWDEDNNVIRLVENNGATTSWVYDQKTGFPLEIRDAEANKQNWPPTRLTYRTAMDGHVADLTEKVTPEGRKWLFVHDDNGNLLSVTDPKGTATEDPNDYTSRYSHDEFGHLIDQTNANGHTTVFGDYDPNGFPQIITDALNCASRFRYDDIGNVVSTVDARGKTSTFTYDIFKRPLDSREPKDQAAGVYIVTPGPRYDANDNVVTSTAANGAVTRVMYDEMDQQVAVYAPKDTPDGPEKLTTSVYDPVGNLVKQTLPKGMLTSGDPNDFSFTMAYDELGQLMHVTDVNGNRTSAEYDDVGNLVKEVDARKNKTPDVNDSTTRYVFDANHQVVETVDADQNSTKTRYDKDGNVVASTDEDGNETLITLDERGNQKEVRSPHDNPGGTIRYFTTQYEYDQVGNLTRTINPRGVDTPDQRDDFVAETVYDELNRAREEILPYDPGDSEHKSPVSTIYSYDELGRVTEVSAPPSRGQSTRNVTRQTYFDNGWVRTSTDAWDIKTSYDYTPTGQQSNRTVTSAGGSSHRVQTWEYYPDGKLRTRADDGVPVGQEVVLVDNANTVRTQATPGWRTADSPRGFQGSQYRTTDKRNANEKFVWKAGIPTDGNYEVLVRYPEGTATDATYTVEHNGGSSTVKVDQSKRAGEWVSLGKFAFAAGQTRNVTLSGQANGTVSADAVQLVRDNSADVDDERKVFSHFYDANDNLVSLTDSSPGTPVDEFKVTYDGLDLATKVEELADGSVEATTEYRYNENNNLTFAKFDGKSAFYEYNARDLVSKVVNKKSDGDSGRETTFSYTKRGHISRQVKGNGNTVDFTYYLDGLVKRQTEKNSGEIVLDHQLEYDSNSNRSRDKSKKQDADDHDNFIDNDTEYTYDPRDRIRKVDKNGDGDRTENYKHDDNGNVWDQELDGKGTEFEYDRNRLVSSETDDEEEANYDYDAFGKLKKVTQSGEELERYKYDGFDRKIEHAKDDGDKVTTYTYDPLDRERTKEEDDGETTVLHYLGLSEQVLTEEEDGDLTKSYQYSADGEMLGQIHYDDGDEDQVYLSFNAHSDVEMVTDSDGDAQSTYGYTAYGKDDVKDFTGEDKPAPLVPDKDEKNSYRFNTARHDKDSGTYDMGFRDYAPGLNRFLTLDLYNGALSDLGMTTDPWTNNRYTFGAGNPLSQVEIDGHGWFDEAGKWMSDNASAIGHAALDVAGLVPGVGEVADLANAAWYAAEGDYANAALSAAAAIPFAGWAATAVKAGKYAVKGADAAQGAGKAAEGAGKAADTTATANTAAKAADTGANGAKTAPTPKPSPKVGGPSAGKPAGAGGGKAGGTASTGQKPSGGGSGGGQAANGGGSSATKGTNGNSNSGVGQGGNASKGGCNSFTPETPVLMADGSRQAIKDIGTGDLVVATDPDTGTTSARRVSALIVGDGDKDLVELTVDTDGNAGHETGVVVTTDNHPFWIDDEGRWLDADEVRAGQRVRSVSGMQLEVLTARTFQRHGQRVHNLTVEGVHTYYVGAAAQSVLVHNDSCDVGGGSAPEAKGGVYKITTDDGTVVRTGMAKNIANREAQHRKLYGELNFQVVHRTDDRATRRGLEQMLNDKYRPILNKINPIAWGNKNRSTYMNAARKFLEENGL
ncbi:golvesin C-terminal-like domain-containing protein [Saccharothrix deserti]|uniref:golvesin C-terminal-like domain-containing protein n=1 Tax=Saccharothrix deserti TaxID=2593674 RepID=UPI00131B3AB5|nr:polymorphic toxin-type HINT domain-containing protein [Saccharothrix deserti]